MKNNIHNNDEVVEKETTWEEAGFSVVDGDVLSVPLTTETIYDVEEEDTDNEDS
jgi:hypothetical protein